MTNNNSFDCAVDIMNFINDNIDTYKRLEDNWLEQMGDYENANRCFYYRQALANVSDDIDSIIHHHAIHGLDVYTILDCPSFIWSLQSRIAKHIDYINGWGYQYIMRGSAMLRHKLYMYECIYEYTVSACKHYNVYC